MTWTVLWSVEARDQYLASVARVAEQDPLSAELVNKRVKEHSFDCRLVREQIRIQRWYRQRQKPVDDIQSGQTNYPDQ